MALARTGDLSGVVEADAAELTECRPERLEVRCVERCRLLLELARHEQGMIAHHRELVQQAEVMRSDVGDVQRVLVGQEGVVT